MNAEWNYHHILSSLAVGALAAIALARIKTINIIVDHTLKNPRTGEWSRKNLTGVAAFLYSVYYCQDCLIKGIPVQVEVLLIWNATALTCLGISSWEKFQIKPKPTEA